MDLVTRLATEKGPLGALRLGRKMVIFCAFGWVERLSDDRTCFGITWRQNDGTTLSHGQLPPRV